MHRHRWTVVERIGAVTVQRCTRCPKTRVRVRQGDPVTDDHRERIAVAVLDRLRQPGPTPSEYDLADAVLAVRDAEVERLRAEVARLNATGEHR